MSWDYGYGKSSRDWKRENLARFDEAWEELSVDARKAVLLTIPIDYDSRDAYSGVTIEKVGEKVAFELIAAKIVRLATISNIKGEGKRRVIIATDARSFVSRMKDLEDLKLLRETEVRSYNHRLGSMLLGPHYRAKLVKVIEEAGLPTFSPDAEFEAYVMSPEWTELALRRINNPEAERVVAHLKEKDAPPKLKELLARLSGTGHPKAKVARAVEDLIEHMAIFEDLNATTHEIHVGFLPVIRLMHEAARAVADPKVAARPMERVTPAEESPAFGMIINDVRSFLMEVLATPPSLKQDGALYQKDEQRLLATLVPWPEWVMELYQHSPPARLDTAMRFSENLGFVDAPMEGNSQKFQITEKGRKWLAQSPNRQYDQFYTEIREENLVEQAADWDDSYDEDEDLDYNPFGIRSMSSYYRTRPTEMAFLGVPISIRFLSKDSGKKATRPKLREPEGPDKKAFGMLREAIFSVLDRLPEGQFVLVNDLVRLAVTGTREPLQFGRRMNEVEIWMDGIQVPPIGSKYLATWSGILASHVMERLIPLDALRLGRTKDKQVCIARTPLLSAYYGKAKLPLEPESLIESSVIVQPDFTVTVIGLGTAAAATLSGFCDRVQGLTGTGALTYKITRDSIRRAVTESGLTGPKIVKTLESLVTKGLPPNVATEILGWADWVRKVNIDLVSLVRCPDAETTSRVVAALGKKAERISDHFVALKVEKILSAERQKLLAQGIVITKDLVALPTDPKPDPKPNAAEAKAAPKKKGRPKKS